MSNKKLAPFLLQNSAGSDKVPELGRLRVIIRCNLQRVSAKKLRPKIGRRSKMSDQKKEAVLKLVKDKDVKFIRFWFTDISRDAA